MGSSIHAREVHGICLSIWEFQEEAVSIALTAFLGVLNLTVRLLVPSPTTFSRSSDYLSYLTGLQNT